MGSSTKGAGGGLRRCNQITMLHERHKKAGPINLWLTKRAVFRLISQANTEAHSGITPNHCIPQLFPFKFSKFNVFCNIE